MKAAVKGSFIYYLTRCLIFCSLRALRNSPWFVCIVPFSARLSSEIASLQESVQLFGISRDSAEPVQTHWISLK